MLMEMDSIWNQRFEHLEVVSSIPEAEQSSGTRVFAVKTSRTDAAAD